MSLLDFMDERLKYLQESSKLDYFSKEVELIEKQFNISGLKGIKSTISNNNVVDKSINEIKPVLLKMGYKLYPLSLSRSMGLEEDMVYFYKKLPDGKFIQLTVSNDSTFSTKNKSKIMATKTWKQLGFKETVYLEGDDNMFSNFLEGDSTQEVPEEVKVKKEVDYAPLGEPITGDPIKDLPHEKQPDYVPSGYEEGDPKDNCTSCKGFTSNFEEEIHESVAEWHDEYSNKIIGGSFNFK